MSNHLHRGRLHRLLADQGSSLIETALVMPVLLFIVTGVVDYGRVCSAAIEVSSAAEAGALYGTLNATDTAGMVKAALLDAPDVSTLTPVATYGCECSDGSSVSVSCVSIPACSHNVVNFVEVDTSATYTPIFPFPGIPSSIALAGTAHMRLAH